MIEFIGPEHKIGEGDDAQEDDVGEEYGCNVGAGNNFVADSDVQFDNVAVEVEEDDENLDASDDVVKEIILEGPECEQIDKVEYLK